MIVARTFPVREVDRYLLLAEIDFFFLLSYVQLILGSKTVKHATSPDLIAGR